MGYLVLWRSEPLHTMTSEDVVPPTSHLEDDDDDDEICAVSGNSLLPALLEKLEVSELRALLELRKQGWEDNDVDQAFSTQRATTRAPSANSKKAWFSMLKSAMREMNDFACFVPSSRSYRFLDLGCCPGGFTSYILSFNPDAQGMGISLPIRQGGYEYTLEKWLRPRMKVTWADLSYYKLHPSANELRGQILAPFPHEHEYFDLVIVEGNFAHATYRSPRLAPPEPWDNHRWWISQIIIALTTVKNGGTIVMKLSHIEWTNTAQTLYLLDVLSANLMTYKPQSAHARRGTFYAIATGVGHGRKGSLKAEYLRQYQQHWYEISYGGEEGNGRWSTKSDMDFVVSFDGLVDGYLERVAELGREPWVVQSNALRNMLEKAEEKRRKAALADEVTIVR
ncbi:hypothetical protein BC629DRAFT_1498771 [Irpex lacteus]|nr:hypothetical protein BC629DRAFT_1498771 [Irpex lacteus]